MNTLFPQFIVICNWIWNCSLSYWVSLMMGNIHLHLLIQFKVCILEWSTEEDSRKDIYLVRKGKFSRNSKPNEYSSGNGLWPSPFTHFKPYTTRHLNQIIDSCQCLMPLKRNLNQIEITPKLKVIIDCIRCIMIYT